jgi:DNA-directed RNA polymerase subunit M/transcription elongation factor TFIIS
MLMEFCETCDSLLMLKRDKENNRLLHCRECNIDKPLDDAREKDYVMKEEIQHDETSKIEVIEHETDTKISDEIREELMESYRESIESFQY